MSSRNEKDDDIQYSSVLLDESGDAPGGSRTVESTEGSPHAWVLLALIHLGVTVTYGMTTCVGVFHLVFLDEFEQSNGATSWIGSLNTAFSMFSAMVCGLLTRRYQSRPLTILGVLLCTVGLFTSAYARSVVFLYISYGIVTGCGVGFIYMGLCSCMAQTFHRRLSLASGIGTSAVGLSTLIYPPLINTLQNQYGWRSTFIILSAIILQYAVPICFIKPIVKPELRPVKFDVCQVHLLKEIRFALFMWTSLILHVGVSICIVHLEAFADNQGVSYSKWLIPLYGSCNCLGRALFGAIGNLPCVEATKAMLTCNFVSGLCIGLLPLCGSSNAGALASVAIYGLFQGINGYTAFAHVERYFDRELLSAAYGYILFADGIGFLFGAPLAGVMYDVTDDYSWSMYVGGGFTCLSSFTLLPEACGFGSKPKPLLDRSDADERDDVIKPVPRHRSEADKRDDVTEPVLSVHQSEADEGDDVTVL